MPHASIVTGPEKFTKRDDQLVRYDKMTSFPPKIRNVMSC